MSDAGRGPVTWSMAGFRQGALEMLPVLPGMIVFAAGYGTIAAQKGVTLGELILTSAIVYAGASQLVALEMWTDHWTLAAAVTVVLVTFTVNLRMVLMSAAMHPWLSALPTWQAMAVLFFNVDANWLAAMRYHGRGGRDVATFVGGGVMLWCVWIAATVPGYLLGALIADPKRYALDLVLPTFFLAMIVPVFKGRADLAGWGTAAAVALLVQAVVPGWWFIIAGAICGALVGGYVRGR